MMFEWITELVPQSAGQQPPAFQSHRSIKRRGRSVFAPEECWGYDRFYPLSQLEPEGFINAQDGSLLLRFAVRPISYSLYARLLESEQKQLRGSVGCGASFFSASRSPCLTH